MQLEVIDKVKYFVATNVGYTYVINLLERLDCKLSLHYTTKIIKEVW